MSHHRYAEEIRSLLGANNNLALAAAEFRQELRNSQVYIYGAGNAGATTFRELTKAGIEVAAFFDQRGGSGLTYFEKPVFGSDAAELKKRAAENAVLIIAFLCGPEELLKKISFLESELGWKKVYYFFGLYNGWLHYGGEPLKDKADIEKIVQAALLCADDESFSVYTGHLNSMKSCNPRQYAVPTKQPQYFVSDVPFARGYSRFVDCGAFDGDTLRALKASKGAAELIVCFEPDPANFRKLCNLVKSGGFAKEQFLFPCAVAKNTETARFHTGGDSSSGVSPEGAAHVQCVALDDVIPECAPTFIKMDIEGAEPQALWGAEALIRKNKPDMAICVYHRLEHLWEIPLIIKSIEPSYHFYLRSHAALGMETVLYCVTEKQAANHGREE